MWALLLLKILLIFIYSTVKINKLLIRKSYYPEKSISRNSK